jgi:hypothetical protein
VGTFTVYVKGTPLTGTGPDIIRTSSLTVGDGSQLVEPLTDVVGLADTRTRGVGRTFAEAASLADQARKDLTRTWSEGLTLTDTRGGTDYSKAPTEVLGLVDQAPRKDLTRVRTEAVFLSGGPAEEVVWTSLVNATATGNHIQKNLNSYDFDAGGVSAQSINGDGYAEFRSLGVGVAVGLSNGNPGVTRTEIDYCFWVYDQLYIYENGTSKGSFPTSSSDVLRISVDNGTVRYWRNGVVIYTSLTAPTLPLLVDTSLYNYTDGYLDAWIAGGNLSLRKDTVRTFPAEAATLTDPAVTANKGANNYTKDDLAEVLGLADSVRKDTSRTLVDGVALADIYISAKARTLTETVAATDTVRKAAAKAPVETVGLTDTLTLGQTQKNLAETLVLSDIKETQHGGNSTKELPDPIQLTDVFSREASYQRTLTESAGLTGVLSWEGQHILTETVSLGHEVLNLVGVELREPLTLTDAAPTIELVTNDYTKELTETAALLDTLILEGEYTQQLLEAVVLGDGLVCSPKVLAEQVVLADQLTATKNAGSYTKELTETAVLADDPLTLTGIELWEGVGLAGTLTTAPSHYAQELLQGISLTDPAITTVQVPAHYTKTLTDGVTLTDPQLERGVEPSGDGVTLGAGIQRAVGRTLTEGLVLTPTEEHTHTGTGGTGHTKELLETAQLVDTVTKQGTYERTLTDGVALADTRELGGARVLTEGLTLTDPAPTTQHVSTCPYSDYFSELDSSKWAVTSGVSIDSDRLKLTLAGSGDVWATSANRWKLTGAFDFNTYIPSISLEAAPDLRYQYAGIGFSVDPVCCIAIAINQASQYRVIARNELFDDSVSEEVAVTPTNLRLRRDSSGNVYAYYWDQGNSRYEWNGDTNGLLLGTTNDDLSVYLTLHNPNFVTSTVYFDEFVITEGCPGIIDVREPVDAVTLTDTTRRDITRTLDEGLGLADTREQAVARTYSETISLVDPVVTPLKSGYTQELTETVGLGDTAQKATTRTLVEAAQLADRLISNTSLLDGVVLTDTPTKEAGRTWVESVALSPTLVLAGGRQLTELAELVDSLTKQVNYQRVLVEQAYLTDVQSAAGTYNQSLTDSLQLTDSLVVEGDRSRTLTETITLSEIMGIRGLCRDTVVLADSLTLFRTHWLSQRHRLTDTLEVVHNPGGAYRTDSLTLEAGVQKDVSKTLLEGVTVSDVLPMGSIYDTELSLMFAG